ncbi:hypothetical protein TorRG33x02_212610, partial [Trema orientale]
HKPIFSQGRVQEREKKARSVQLCRCCRPDAPPRSLLRLSTKRSGLATPETEPRCRRFSLPKIPPPAVFSGHRSFGGCRLTSPLARATPSRRRRHFLTSLDR